MKLRYSLLAALGALVTGSSLGAVPSMADEVKAINDSWAHIAYEMNGSSHQAAALGRLDREASVLVARYPNQAEPLLWEGIVVSEEANRANFLHKLSLATRARDLIAKAYAINPKAANGGAAMSLAVLYYKVPGSPIGFGDKARAGRLLKEAMALDPNGLDTNYFYADYLHTMGNDAAAKSYLQKALRVPHDPLRPVWDAGRRREVQALLSQIG